MSDFFTTSEGGLAIFFDFRGRVHPTNPPPLPDTAENDVILSRLSEDKSRMFFSRISYVLRRRFVTCDRMSNQRVYKGLVFAVTLDVLPTCSV